MSTSNLKSLTRALLEIAGHSQVLKHTASAKKIRKRTAARLRTLRQTVGHRETRFKYRWGTYW
jgi:hypothetical protein